MKPNPLDKFPKNFVKTYNTYEDGENIVVGPNNQIMMESELKKQLQKETIKPAKDIGSYFTAKQKTKIIDDDDYSNEGLKKHILKRQRENIKSGRRIYEGFSSSDIVVSEDIKEKAKAKLKQLKNFEKSNPIKLNINKPAPRSLTPNSSLDLQKQRLDQMIKESEQEKAREKLINSTRGLASFAPGVFNND